MLGWPEILLILGVMLIFIGPSKLPEMAKSLGQAFKEFQKATAGIENEAKALTKALPDLNAPVLNVPPNLQIHERGRVMKPKPVEAPKSIDNVTVSPSQIVGEASPSIPLETETKNENLVEVAKVLGISAEGRSEEDLKTAIHDRIEGLDEKEV